MGAVVASVVGPPGRAVVVTGASSGIGKAIALGLAERGFRVYAGVRSRSDADALASAAAAANTPLDSVILDVTNAEHIASVVEQVTADVGATGLAGVVNNAGIAVAGPMEFIPLEDLREQFEINVLGKVAVTQAFMPLIRSSRGRIVFIGSVSGLVSSRLLGSYSASKFALEAVADAFRRELQQWRIGVSIVEPGRIATPIWKKSVELALSRLERMPPEATSHYEAVMQEVIRGAEEATRIGTPPAAVARAVHRALTDPRPRTRYFVGTDAHIINVLRRVLSDPLFDRLIRATGR
jgi:NAD(P)-dependent dehydrogenase (short-subunit alcohol dehydrogenase family)